MPDDLHTRAPTDPSRVNLQDPDEVEYWTRRFGCSREQLEAAVRAVGTAAVQITEHLQPAPPLPVSRIHLHNFRSFHDLAIGPFRRVNLITGLNNSGKTGLLEGIFLALHREGEDRRTHAMNLPDLFRISSPQADLNESFWPWLFRNKKLAEDFRIILTDGKGNEEEVVVSQQQHVQTQKHAGFLNIRNLGPFFVHRRTAPEVSWPLPAVFASYRSDPVQDAIDYNRVILRRGKKKVEELLRQIDPRLQAIEALQTGQRPLLYADIALPEMIPVAHLGEGFCRLLDIFSEILAGEARVLLIDEIENGLHHTVLPIVWKGLLTAARDLDVQIFATTHSAECIFAADQAARQSQPYALNLIRLDRVDGEIKATIVDENAMETAKEFGWELR